MPVPSNDCRKFTYADYLTWADGERWELVDGEAFAMTPAPSFRHQRIVARLIRFLDVALEGHPCVPFVAPVDVVLTEHTVVQPDVGVVCDAGKIRAEGVFGAPDLIFEVLSPSTALKDRRSKLFLYERAGVREYVVVDAEAQYVERFLLGPDGTYGRGELLGSDELLVLRSLQGLQLALWQVFELEPPREPPSGD